MTLLFSLLSRLRWISEARTSASAIVHSLISRSGTIVINLTTSIIVARTLGPVGRGTTAALLLCAFLISGLSTLGIPAALRYVIRREPTHLSDSLSIAMLLTGVLGTISVILGFFTVPVILASYPREVVHFAQLMTGLVPLLLWNATLQAFYEAKGDYRRSNALTYLPPIGTLLCLFSLIEVGRLTPFSVALAYQIPFALSTVLTIFRLRQMFRVPPSIVTRSKEMLSYGIRSYGLDIVAALEGQLDQVIVVGLLSSSSFGYYTVALNGSRLLWPIGLALNGVLFPKASGLDSDAAVTLVNRAGSFVFPFSAITAAAFVTILPLAIPLAYGSAFVSIIWLTQLLTIGVVVSITTTTFSQSFMATGRPEIATVLQLTGIVTTSILMLLLVPKYGLIGTAYAIDVSSILRLVLVLLAYPLIMHKRIPAILPSKRDIAMLIQRARPRSSTKQFE